MTKNEIIQGIRELYNESSKKAAEYYNYKSFGFTKEFDNSEYKKHNDMADFLYSLMEGVEKLHETKHVVKHEALNLQRVSQRSELLIALLIENIDKFIADDNFVKMSNSYKKLKAIYCG